MTYRDPSLAELRRLRAENVELRNAWTPSARAFERVEAENAFLRGQIKLFVARDLPEATAPSHAARASEILAQWAGFYLGLAIWFSLAIMRPSILHDLGALQMLSPFVCGTAGSALVLFTRWALRGAGR